MARLSLVMRMSWDFEARVLASRLSSWARKSSFFPTGSRDARARPAPRTSVEVGLQPADLLGQVIALGQERGLFGQLAPRRRRSAPVEIAQPLLEFGLEAGPAAVWNRPSTRATTRRIFREMDAELAGRLPALLGGGGARRPRASGRSSVSIKVISLGPRALTADLDELGHPEKAVEGDLQPHARPAGDTVEGSQDLLEKPLVQA